MCLYCRSKYSHHQLYRHSNINMACLNQVLDLGWPRGFCGTDDRMHSNESGFREKPGLLDIIVCAMSSGLKRSTGFAGFRLCSK